MAKTVLKIENVSKLYRLGEIGTGTLSHDLNRWWHRMRGKEDPYQQIGTVNQRNQKGDTEYVWALKDINLEVKEGEILGIIGANGAGKSTLLKILSKVTAPTTGRIRGKGKVSALLEVGTGFHPELTARDNIYLNGAILGMRRHEVSTQLDEIVDFAGIERYLDTPIKRFSSGMKVRLGFAVAAHLNTDILIVDEVLAVGDAEFQQKCIGKMGEISEGEGKTVLFVSHNMQSIRQLCNRGVLLEKGQTKAKGTIDRVINTYLSTVYKASKLTYTFPVNNNSEASITSITILNSNGKPTLNLKFHESFTIKLEVEANHIFNNAFISFFVSDINGNIIFTSKSCDDNQLFTFQKGLKKISIIYDSLYLTPGIYSFGIRVVKKVGYVLSRKENLPLIIKNDFSDLNKLYTAKKGVIHISPIWKSNNN